MNQRSRGKLALIMILLVLLQFYVRPRVWDSRAAPDFVMLALLIYATRASPGSAAVAGFLTGIMMDALPPARFGATAMANTMVGYLAAWGRAVFFADNLLSLGVPMILMGDEVRRTQNGNNNTYCQDIPSNWLDWTLLEQHADIHRFVQRLIRFRLSLPVREKEKQSLSLTELLRRTPIHWHGVKLDQPDWGPNSHCVAFSIEGRRYRFHIMLNAYWNSLAFELPPLPASAEAGWRRLIDTHLDSPHDICEPVEAPPVNAETYVVHERSTVLLMADLPEG